MIPAHPLPPEPVTSVPMDTWQPSHSPSPDEIAQALRGSIVHDAHAAVYSLGDWFVAFCTWLGVPFWAVLTAVAVMYRYRNLWKATPYRRQEVHARASDPRKDSEPVDGPRGSRGWECRYCGVRRAFYGTLQQEAQEALDHEAKCPSRPDAPAVRRCRECAAPIDPVDPVDDLLDGLFEDDDEPGLTGWKPGMPAWGTPPLLPLRNQARAELFRQMMSDALRRSKG